MKKGLIIIFLCFVKLAVGQAINQFDEQGKRHGVWKKVFDGTTVLRYEGEFNHGKETGLFKYYKYIDKQASLTATKQFHEDDNKAYVTFYTSKGKVISEGMMHGKIYIGEWKYYQKNSNQLLILEHYNAQGLLEGDRFVYYENGQIAEKQFYSKGVLEGLTVLYSEKNVVLKVFNYVNGELHGLSKFYNPKGDLILEGYYKSGAKHGVWKYYENGKLIEEKNFANKPKQKSN
ncbi:MAG: toxin-antitoxin system YwqK family antitoxin [Flavobacteriales bacterium]|nr:toxin-antitoxin system YwqK family antitoxin [Flavobacteriia bacterium]NCP05135.1 toxin-antitoxin system YwqK family antitoxin [Flavobacteriales bacterium]PIV93311.1 MAG: preprotein translocase YidC [Flavobacteriaceae bacterium CG17_big_fil_post_rev_8_21_14_2_50_33_15]PIY10364.1 MAG: preprotein translocase YidC [Flavobacteriaceae bacterium CG_4_10_14_3_um_filter_33_47]PJB20385.1 MAG: preprotein translocase YidC [Flavobacteriaceae bacterium CG_4_9_14_3_um_filter_33_16]